MFTAWAGAIETAECGLAGVPSAFLLPPSLSLSLSLSSLYMVSMQGKQTSDVVTEGSKQVF